MSENVTPMQDMSSYSSIMDANAHLMSEVYNDPKLTASEKLKNFSVGVRNQVALSRDLAARRAELMKFGMKAGEDLKALSFDPMAQAA